VIAALLLVAAFAAAPANAQEATPVTGASDPPPVTELPPPDQPPAPDPGAGSNPSTPTPPADTPPADQPPANPPVNDPPPPPVDQNPTTGDGGGNGGGVTEPDRPAHPGNGSTSSTSGPADSWAPSSSTTGSEDTTVTGTGTSTNTSDPDSWLGQDTFIVDKTAAGHDDSAAATIRSRFGGLILLGASSHAKEIEAKARRSNETAKVSALGGGPPGPGHQLPGQNPFFNLLSGPGGIAANLMLAGLLAVLGAAFVLPRDRLRALRMPTATWRPLAYVPPIELPG